MNNKEITKVANYINNYNYARNYEDWKQSLLGDAADLERLKHLSLLTLMYAMDGNTDDVDTIFTDGYRDAYISGMQRALNEVAMLFCDGNEPLKRKYENIIAAIESNNDIPEEE